MTVGVEVRLADRYATWGLGTSDARTLEGALYVRDALRLAVPDRPQVPHGSDPFVPDRSRLVDPAQRDLITSGWLVWWDRLLGDLRRPWGLDERLVGCEHSPELLAPADPVLNVLVDQLRHDFYYWVRPGPDPGPPFAFRRRVLNSIAETLANEWSRPIGTLRGSVELVLTPGLWWTRTSRGVTVCTWDASNNRSLVKDILHSAFGPAEDSPRA